MAAAGSKSSSQDTDTRTCAPWLAYATGPTAYLSRPSQQAHRNPDADGGNDAPRLEKHVTREPAEYQHPASGRVYRVGDPAHHFARLVQGLARQCESFLYHYERRLEAHDYLQQHIEWTSDPDRIARAMKETIAAIDQAYNHIIMERTMPDFGLGEQDEEWYRKYGSVDKEKTDGV
jgi:hypothetical protein